jgi:DNA-directed RNA polymerase subunit B
MRKTVEKSVVEEVDFYPLVLAFFRERGLVDPQIESFNRFLERGLQEVIETFKEIELIEGYKLVLKGITIGRPEIDEYDGAKLPILPVEARLRNATYQAPMELEISVYSSGMELKTEKIPIGHLPIMAKSKACRLYGLDYEKLEEVGEDPLDLGGYFIINGSERVLVIRDDVVPNKVIVEETRAENKPYSHSAQVVSELAGFRSRLFMEYYLGDGTIKASVGGLRKIPVAIFFKALGMMKDSDILASISSNPEIQNEFLYSLEDAQRALRSEGTISEEDALDFIGRRLVQSAPKRDRIRIAKDYLKNRFLPHMGTKEEDFKAKAYFLAKAIGKLIRVVRGMCEPDDKDHFSNKRLRLAGNLMQELFRDAFYQYITRLKEKAEEQLSQGVYDIELRRKVVGELYITKRMLRAMATGAWPRGELGVSQNLDRTNYMAALHHVRRVSSSLPPGLPLHEIRQIHGTSVGRLCPLETPEGTNVGLVRSLALMASVTYGIDIEPIIRSLREHGMKPIEEAIPAEVGSLVPVYVNGKLVGLTDDPEELVSFMKKKRLEISHEINVVYMAEENAVHINADSGRVQRPLIPVDRIKDAISLLDKVKKGELTLSDLFRMGIMEFLDPDEEENAVIAYDIKKIGPEHTHLDFAPYAMLGATANQIPYAEHNAIPRDIIGSNMVRQGIGVYAPNWRLRTDSRSYILFYPQKPIVYTRGAEIVGYHLRPSGQNLVVALMPMDGYNMDDAVVLNQGAVDRGMARIVAFRAYEAIAKRQAIIEGDKIENPLPLKNVTGKLEEQKYQKLGDDGIVDLETYVVGGDVLIGRTSPPRFAHSLIGVSGGMALSFERRDTSVLMRTWEEGIVNDVLLVTTPSGERLVKIRVREVRPPIIGDKFATRHGQKGVVGMIFKEEDMPFTSSGIVPDIILDSHAIPSRMTIGQLIEILAGKLGALKGTFIDGTPFMNEKVDSIMDGLRKLGFEYSGMEIMYDGRTGRMIKAPIFIGVGFYQRLKHLVRDKIHARARGQVQLLTRQPVEGRARGGGLRLGEMEGEVLISHGAAAVLYDRYVENSDKEIVYICKRCNSLAYFNAITNQFYCPRCKDNVEVYPVVTTHATALMVKELMSGLIDARLRVEEI